MKGKGAAVAATNGSDGLVLIGAYEGRKAAREYTDRADGQTKTARPKLGIRVGDRVYSVTVGTDEELAAITSGLVKGDAVSIPVLARPPFGSRGEVNFTTTSVGEGDGGWQ